MATPDRLEELRSELADVETALGELGREADEAGHPGEDPQPLQDRADALRAQILHLERAAREEMGVQPAVEADAELVSESRPTAAELVVPSLPPGDERDTAAMLVLDKHDEDQVLAMVEERMDAVLMFDFDGKVDLSVNGVFECVRLLNSTGHAKIGIEKGTLTVEIEPGADGPEYVATVAARDTLTDLLVYASATVPKMMKRRNGSTVPDPFARQKAISKAQRNAMKRFIPERLRQGMLAMHKGNAQRVLEVKHGAGAAAAAQLPAPVDTPRARGLEDECRALYAAAKGLPGWQGVMLPGRFGAKFDRARSSETALETFRDELVAMLEHLVGEAPEDHKGRAAALELLPPAEEDVA